jgi:hypothetical protein
MLAGVVQDGLISPVPFGLYVDDVPFHAGDDGNEFRELVQALPSASRRKNVTAEVIHAVSHPVVTIVCD